MTVLRLYIAVLLVYSSSTRAGVFAHKCKLGVESDITDGVKVGNSITKGNITYTDKDYFRKNDESGQIFGCPCDSNPCLVKCCPIGQILNNSGCSGVNESLPTINVYDVEKDLGVREVYFYNFGARCKANFRSLFPLGYPDHKFFIQEDGRLYISNDSAYVKNELFCIEDYEPVPGVRGLFARVCIEEKGNAVYTGMIISMPFLLATFLVYAFLPDRNLPAKALMCYVLSLLFAYILLVTIQLDNGHESTTCIALAFFCYFFFMASFFWMNASCLDIFFTFSGIRGLLGERKKENRRFMYYSAYAWGVPVLLVAFAAFFTFGDIENSNSNFYTGLGNGQCWFRSGWPTGIYFYFPIATLLIINIVLFGITTYKIKKVQRDTKMLKNVDSRKHKYDNNDKQRFNLYVKLLFAMGINWSMEVISWVVLWKLTKVPDYVWILTDFCNAVYGVFIFFIFVFKRNIWMLLKKRYLQLTGRPQQAHTLTSTHRTTVSQVSSSEA